MTTACCQAAKKKTPAHAAFAKRARMISMPAFAHAKDATTHSIHAAVTRMMECADKMRDREKDDSLEIDKSKQNAATAE